MTLGLVIIKIKVSYQILAFMIQRGTLMPGCLRFNYIVTRKPLFVPRPKARVMEIKMIGRKKHRRVLSIILILCVLLACMPATAAADTAVGEEMRLARAEGSVTVTNKDGKEVPVIHDMKLYSGYRITTAKDSYAYISLDSTKAVKLDCFSTVEVQKAGKRLEAFLETGGLFFNVKVPLKSDETMNIRTSTMVTGIRGTSGIMNINGEQVSSLSLLDGSVSVQTWDRAAKRMAEAHIEGGQKITVFPAQTGAVSMDIGTVSVQDIPAFARVELARDPQLQKRITQVDIAQIVEGSGTENSGKTVQSPVRKDPYADESEDTYYQPPSNPGPSVKPPAASVTIPADELDQGNLIEILEDAFKSYNTVTIGAGNFPVQLSGNLTVPAHKTLIIRAPFQNWGELTVKGTLEIPEGSIFTNYGEVSNEGEFHVAGRYRSYANPSNSSTDSDRLPLFTNKGTLINSGIFQPTLKGQGSDDQPNFIGCFVNEEEGGVKNEGKFQLMPGNNFDLGHLDHWTCETGVFFTPEIGSSSSLPQDFKDVCEKLGATFYIRTRDFSGTDEKVFAAGRDFQWLVDQLASEIWLEDDTVIGEGITIKNGRVFSLCMQDYTLTFDGGGFTNYGELVLAGSSRMNGSESQEQVKSGALIGINTDCLIDNRSGSLYIDNLQLKLESSDTIGGKSYTIDNRSDFYPGNMDGGTQLFISNETENGYALYNRSGGSIRNDSSKDVIFTLQSFTEGFTVNAPRDDSMGQESSESMGFTRDITLPPGRVWRPALSQYGLRKNATPSQAQPLDEIKTPETATDSNAAPYDDEEDELEKEPDRKATPSQAVKDPEQMEPSDLLESQLPTEPEEEADEPLENSGLLPAVLPGSGEEEQEPEDGSEHNPADELKEPTEESSFAMA